MQTDDNISTCKQCGNNQIIHFLNFKPRANFDRKSACVRTCMYRHISSQVHSFQDEV